MLVISNRPRATRSSDFEITHALTPRIVLHSVQLLLLLKANVNVIQIVRHRLHLKAVLVSDHPLTSSETNSSNVSIYPHSLATSTKNLLRRVY